MPMTELARKYAPWSASMLTSAHACPQQFYLMRVVRAEKTAAASDNQVGVAAHAYLERRVLGDDARVAESTALQNVPLTSNEHEAFRSLLAPADAFVKRFAEFCSRENVTKIVCERKWAISEDFSFTPFSDSRAMFRGVVDLAAITSRGDVYIVDHKSGAVRSAEEKADQLDAYAVMALANATDLGVSQIAGARCGINSLANPGPTQLLWLPYRTSSTIRAVQCTDLVRMINEAAEQLGDFPTRPGKKGKWPCQFCGYRLSCNASQARS